MGSQCPLLLVTLQNDDMYQRKQCATLLDEVRRGGVLLTWVSASVPLGDGDALVFSTAAASPPRRDLVPRLSEEVCHE